MRISQAHEPDLWGMLSAGPVDAIVSWLPPQSAGMASVPLQEVDFWAAVPESWTGAGAATIDRAVLVQGPLAMWYRTIDPFAYDYWTALIAEGFDGGVAVHPVAVNDNAQEAVLAAVADGDAVSFVVAGDWRSYTKPGVTVRPLTPPLTAPLRLSWRQDSDPSWTVPLLEVFATGSPGTGD